MPCLSFRIGKLQILILKNTPSRIVVSTDNPIFRKVQVCNPLLGIVG